VNTPNLKKKKKKETKLRNWQNKDLPVEINTQVEWGREVILKAWFDDVKHIYIYIYTHTHTKKKSEIQEHPSTLH
jgi:hypothetical protein